MGGSFDEQSFTSSSSGAFLTKLDSNGTRLFTRLFGVGEKEVWNGMHLI